jgi:hypothetical protein
VSTWQDDALDRCRRAPLDPVGDRAGSFAKRSAIQHHLLIDS